MEIPEGSVLARDKLRSPKKRRRRAPAMGAANDCFTCQELRKMCDRRRPYCTQCLEHGKNCSGYKTTLTWDVGVASRGKLRGLALPIATSEKVSRRSIARERKKWIISNQASELGPESSGFLPAMTSRPSYPLAKFGTKQYSFVNMEPNHSTSPGARCHSAPQSDVHTSPRIRKRLRRHSIEPVLVPDLDYLRGSQDLPMSASVLGLYDDLDFGMSVESSPKAAYVATSVPQSRELPDSLANFDPMNGDLRTGHELMWCSQGKYSNLSSDQPLPDYPTNKPLSTTPISAGRTDNILFTTEPFDGYGFAANSEAWVGPGAFNNMHSSAHKQIMNPVAPDCDDQWALDFSEPRSCPSPQTNNLRFLIDYYDRVIPPVSAALGGPSHPYKAYMLLLAVRSETLQHAIAALSANYMRQRSASSARTMRSNQPFSDFFHDEFVRKYSPAHNTLDAGRNLTATLRSTERLEEGFFKEASLRMLNEHFMEIDRRKDDSLRATILILCLYHVCGTRLADLRQCFAVAMKIVSWHSENSTVNFKATIWLAVMFAWFDSTTSTGGPGKEHFPGAGMIASGVDEKSYTFESFAGCHGKLFSIIIKLGRLNFQSGDPSVQGTSSLQSTSLGFGRMPSPVDKGNDYYSMNPTQIDGSHPVLCVDTETDARVQLWRERNQIRAELEGWQWDPLVRYPNSPEAAAPLRQISSAHVSESFRYAALLYIECLNFPRVREMQPHLDSIVKRLVFHVSNIQTDVSLLLPLFIAGLGSPSQQICHLMSEGCLDMLEDSDFFKNVSALELLHHLWGGDDDDDGTYS